MKATSMEAAAWVWPVRVWGNGGKLDGRGGSRITQEFRAGDGTGELGHAGGASRAHEGVDIAVPGHYTDHAVVGEIRAVAAGRVAVAQDGPRGHIVLLDHGDYATGYIHLGDLEVAVGDTVVAGQRLGQMGADPLDPDGIVHLHFQAAPGGVVVDPAPYLARAKP